MNLRHVLPRCAVLLLVTLSGCLPMASRPSPFGAKVWVFAAGDSARGELLAVSADSMWIAEGEGSRPVQTALPMSGVRRVVVYRGAGWQAFAMRGLAFGFITGLGMYAACTSVAEGCAGILAVSVAVPAVLSLAAGSSISARRELTLTTFTAETLAPYARWPQGRPISRRSTSPPDLPSVP